MDIQQIQNVVNLVAQSQLHEVEIKDNYGHIRVKNRLAIQAQPIGNANLSVIDSTNSLDPVNAGESAPMQTVTSTFIGRIQLAADIASEPLVAQGDKVAVGDTLAYVASLGKLLPVVSDQAGIVREILVNNDDKVEYGSPLFKLSIA